jgi:hypothetical protein
LTTIGAGITSVISTWTTAYTLSKHRGVTGAMAARMQAATASASSLSAAESRLGTEASAVKSAAEAVTNYLMYAGN